MKNQNKGISKQRHRCEDSDHSQMEAEISEGKVQGQHSEIDREQMTYGICNLEWKELLTQFFAFPNQNIVSHTFKFSINTEQLNKIGLPSTSTMISNIIVER